MTFTCSMKNGHKLEKWPGRIEWFKNFGSHYQMRIESRSGITVLFGKTSFGNFACMPDFEVGCHLASLDDEFYNIERLVSALNPVDGITVARTLKFFMKT